MKFSIKFYPDVDMKDIDNGGVMSEISWQRLHTHLEKAFNVRENERLIGITVTELGVKAKFDRIYSHSPNNKLR